MKKNIAKFALEFADRLDAGGEQTKLFDDSLLPKVNEIIMSSKTAGNTIRKLAELGLDDFVIGCINGMIQEKERHFRDSLMKNTAALKEILKEAEKKEAELKGKTGAVREAKELGIR